MRIKTLLQISAASVVLLTAGIGLVVAEATRDSDRIALQSAHTTQMFADVFELHGLAQDYVRYHEERPLRQWHLQYDRLREAMSSPVLQGEPGNGTVAMMQKDLVDIGIAFDKLSTAVDGRAEPALQLQLDNELLVKTRTLVTRIDGLADRTYEARAEARRFTDKLILALLSLIALLAGTLSVVFYRRIMLPILRLREGASVVGKGNLGYKVSTGVQDEIGELAEAFDAMTAKLKKSYDGLEQKVRTRTRDLEDLSQRNRIMLESIGDGLIAIDREWNITLWNRAAEVITGFSKEEAIGVPFRKIVKLIRRADRSENMLFISDAMIDSKVHFMEADTLLVRKDGMEIDVNDSAAPIVEPNGKVTGVIIVFRDASKEKEIERSKNDLVSLVTHELRGPATVIRGYSDLLAETKAVKPEHSRFLTGIRDANERLVELANSLLSVFRTDFGEIVITPEPVDLRAMAEEVLKQQELAIGQKKLQVTTEFDDTMLMMQADKRLAEMTFSNLLSNAVKYTPEGGSIKLEIRKTRSEFRISVTDSGLGIPKEQQAKIFDKFFRATNVKAINGVGVGLHVLRAMLVRAGCTIGFTSQEKKGTTFTVTCPSTGMLKVGT